MKALVIAHGHPEFGAGGGEIAAYALFDALRRQDVAAAFLARTGEPRLPQGAVGRLRDNEYLIRRDIADWPMLVPEPDAAPKGRGLADLLAALSPDTVFVHHYVHLGLPILAAIRAALPAARIVLTLHDYVAICRNGGLMVTTGLAGRPCPAASPAACHACFPDRTPAHFTARRAALVKAFETVDAFVAPSRFLAERYREWGLAPERIHVVPNGTEEPGEAIAPAFAGSPGTPLRLGFFGQARPPKGLAIALAALHHLPKDTLNAVRFDVNASRLDAQDGWYRELVRRLAEPLAADGTVRFRGSYARADLGSRMADVDAVLVPSTWVENAPLVVGEAFAHRRPVIGSNLGGIAEMVVDGTDGLLFAPAEPASLAETLARLVETPGLGARLAAGTRMPASSDATATAYRALADRLVPETSGQNRAAFERLPNFAQSTCRPPSPNQICSVARR